MRSQLRKDLVSGDWVAIVPGRGNRPHQLIKKSEKRKRPSKKDCAFEFPEDVDTILRYGDGNWRLIVINNKYPAFTHRDVCAVIGTDGPYSITDTVGHHELVITHDHHQNFATLDVNDARQVFKAFRDRYLMFLQDKCVSYVSIFHNWGPKAGASIYHPHYQIVAIPVIPPDVEHSLNGSARYYEKHQECVHCVMLAHERKAKKRILFENDGAVAVAPFVSKEPFEIRVFPKNHMPYLENTLDVELDCVVEALQYTLQKFEKNLEDPDYNFFIHTAPIKDKKKYGHYHWHVEVMPKITIGAGFELGTGIEINVIDPDDAAALLRK